MNQDRDRIAEALERIAEYLYLALPHNPKTIIGIVAVNGASTPLYENLTKHFTRVAFTNTAGVVPGVLVYLSLQQDTITIGYALVPQESRDMVVAPGGQIFAFAVGANQQINVSVLT